MSFGHSKLDRQRMGDEPPRGDAISIFGTFGDISADNAVAGEPLVYQGSHVFPQPDLDPRGGSVDLGEIPRFIQPDPADDGADDEGAWPMLRISVRGEPTFRDDYGDTLILTGQQVQLLRDHLNVWLARADVEDGDWQAMEHDRRARWGDGS